MSETVCKVSRRVDQRARAKPGHDCFCWIKRGQNTVRVQHVLTAVARRGSPEASLFVRFLSSVTSVEDLVQR